LCLAKYSTGYCSLRLAGFSGYLLKQELGLFRKLRESWELINEFLEFPLIVCPVDRGAFVEALVLARQYQLLINDATHIALMARQGIQLLATFDRDLQRVDFITCCGED